MTTVGRHPRADPEVAAEVLAALVGAPSAPSRSGRRSIGCCTSWPPSARELVGARYAAIGMPEPEGDEFARFVTVGMSDELVGPPGPAAPHPRAARRHAGRPLALPHRRHHPDPRFRGWWPPDHPDMRSFLGVPIVSAGDIIGAFYLTDKEGASGFTAGDEAAVVLLASHAAIAIDQARLFEDSRELALVQERGRLARELHDAMSQSLFSLQLVGRDRRAGCWPTTPRRRPPSSAWCGRWPPDWPPSCAPRSTVCGPPTWSATGWWPRCGPSSPSPPGRTACRSSCDVGGLPDLDPDVEHQVLRIAQEAVANALRHAGAGRVEVALGRVEGATPAAVRLRVVDDGRGFDPEARAVRSRRLGLTSMHERAASLGGSLGIESAPGRGTTVELEVPGVSDGSSAEPASGDTPIRVVVSDDHPVVRQGLRSFLEAQGFEVVGEAADGAEAVAAGSRAPSPTCC